MTTEKLTKEEKFDKEFRETMGFSEKDLHIIKKQLAVGIKDEDLYYCLTVAKKYNLDPLKNEIYFIERKAKILGTDGKEMWVTKHSPTLGIMGARKIARINGMRIPVQTKWEMKQIPIILNAKAATFEMKQDLVGIATLIIDGQLCSEEAIFSEFKGTNKDDYLTKFWKEKPTEMIMKVAEFKMLKKAYGLEEMDLYEAGVLEDEDKPLKVPKVEILAPTKIENPLQLKQEKLVQLLQLTAKNEGVKIVDLQEGIMKTLNKSMDELTEVELKSLLKENFNVEVKDEL